MPLMIVVSYPTLPNRLAVMVIGGVLSCLTVPARTASTIAAEVDFNRDIRPILTSRCTSCHGGVQEAGGVSFVNGEAADPDEGWLVDIDSPDDSVLMQRITSDDPDEQMPPPGEPGGSLSEADVQRMRQWIAEGADWQRHWSLLPIVDPPGLDPSPEPAASAIDELIDQHRRRGGLNPAPAADPAEWLRRVSFDLTGLPPTIETLDTFVASVEAAGSAGGDPIYAAAIDRMLADPGLGERWATIWLDLARYADSSGYEKDGGRDIWPYRDWVVAAINADVPYDDFTVLQLAGDLLPDADLQRLGGPGQLLATAFHRNTMTNTEGGTDDEEYRVAAVIDRVATTWSVWQGTTMGCVQCHAHPYDAFEHDDFYRSLAIFNNSVDADLPDDFPTISLPASGDLDAQAKAIAAKRRLDELTRRRNSVTAAVVQTAPWFEAAPRRIQPSDGQYEVVVNDGRPQVLLTGGSTPRGMTIACDLPHPATEESPSIVTGVRLKILPASTDPTDWPEQGSTATHVQAEIVAPGTEVVAPEAEDGSSDQPASRKVKLTEVIVDALTNPWPAASVLTDNDQGVGGYPKLHGPRWAVFVPAEPIRLAPGERLRVTLTCRGNVSGGLPTPLRRFELATTADPQLIGIFKTDAIARLDGQRRVAENALARPGKKISVPVMLERQREAIRTTRRFIRGNWLDRDDEVPAGLPAIFAGDVNSVGDRLDFARWLVSDDNPLAARVWANRVWATLFGTGLVETQEDFGSAGLPPSAPELLDRLATRLRRDHRWHLKPLLRELTLSAAYRQSSVAKPAKVAADPANRWIARGPRKRLTAEMVRDASLLTAGLLDRCIGGPPVMPPQPDGVWRSVYNKQEWVDAEGGDRYRRGLYTYIRRTSPYPSFLSFDAPSREVCTTRRINTNTPLQALVTLNDPVYHEAAVSLAQRFDGSPRQRIASMFLAVTGDEAHGEIAAALLALYEDLSDEASDQSTAVEQDAMTTVAKVILNTDEALTQ